MEHNSSGHFYFFGNRAWYDSFQGPAYDNHAKGGVFKTPKEVPAVAGKHYVFHNSFCTHGDYMRNWVLTRFLHSNNAIRFAHAGDPGVTDPTKLGAMFGDLGEPPANLCKRFTTDWRVLCITMDTDVVAHAEWPATVLAKGYPIRPAAGADPVFISPFTGDLALAPPASPCRGAAQPLAIEMVDGSVWHGSAGGDIGAWQQGHLYGGPGFVATP